MDDCLHQCSTLLLLVTTHRIIDDQAVFYALDKVDGYRRVFSINDTSLRHPYAEHERIPVWSLALIAGIFPLLVILIWAGAGRKSWFDAQVGALGLGLTLGLTSTFTNIVKVSVS